MFTVIYILASLIVIYNIYLACVEQCRTLLRITKNCLHNFLLYYLKIHEQIFENLRILLFLFYNVCIKKMRSAHKALRMVYKVTSKTSFLNFRDLHQQKFTGVWSTFYSDVVFNKKQDSSLQDSYFYQKIR